MGKKIDLTGQRFGKLVVVSESTERDKNRNIMWHCLCDCGEKSKIRGDNLKSGRSKSCGCLLSENLDLTGQRFGKLTVIEYAKKRVRRLIAWECLCECGTRIQVTTQALRTGNTKSCGCFKLERSSGENNPSYNPNLTEEERLKNRYELSGGNSRVWSKQVMKRDNYTCQICGNSPSGNLNAHHLNAWNAFPEQRFDLDNGVTLCVDCHKEFHKMYGRGGNTREQFNEYAASKTSVLN